MLKDIIPFLIVGTLALPGIAAAAGTIQLPATKQTNCFDAGGTLLPSCTATGQDGEKRAGVAWPAPRFTDNENGTLTDNLTGLIWSQHANAPNRALRNDPPNGCPKAEYDMLWDEALDFIACLNRAKHAGFSDWRLPNLQELESMTNAGVTDLSVYLNDSGFGLPGLLNSQVQPGPYWTSTSDASAIDTQSAAAAWYVDLVKGDFPSSSIKSELPRGVWPVRDASTALAQLWRTNQTDCYDYLGDKRACSGTGEDGEILAGAVWPVPRFTTNAGANYALDRLTGLIWTTATRTPGPNSCKIIDPNLDWQQALDYVACLNDHIYLGRSDWRLPNRKELRSLADYSRGKPALPAGHPFDDLDGLMYWSSTSVASAPNEAWAVSMYEGGISGVVKTGPQAGTLPVWPVSGPDLAVPILTITQANMTTRVASQTISGTVEAGATVKVTVNNGAPAAASVTGTAWSYIINPLAPGENSVTVTASNFSQNLSSASITITLDTVAPVLAINQGNMTTKVASQTISGTVEAGATVKVSVNGGTPATASVTGTNWSFIINPLAAGVNTVTVTAADISGNMSTASISITLDTVAPAISINPVAAKTNKRNHTISGTVEAGATVVVKKGSTTLPVAVNGTSWSAPVIELATGTNTIVIVAVDAMGNVSPQSVSINLIVPDGIVTGGSKVNINDALKTLRIAVGIIPPADDDLLRGDVAPPGAPDDKIDVSDVVLILKKVVGLQSF